MKRADVLKRATDFISRTESFDHIQGYITISRLEDAIADGSERVSRTLDLDVQLQEEEK